MKKSELQHRNTDELVPFAGNARTHSEQQIEQICESIKKFGFYNPVLIDESGIIIAGHGRIMAAKKMGLATVPTMVIFDLTETERRALTLADNKISLNSSWDMEKVREELSALAESDIDLDLTGFYDFEIESLLRDDLDILPPNVVTSFVEIDSNESKHDDSNDEFLSEEGNDDIVFEKTKEVAEEKLALFEMSMSVDNKNDLFNALNIIKNDNGFNSLEESIMYLVTLWKEV